MCHFINFTTSHIWFLHQNKVGLYFYKKILITIERRFANTFKLGRLYLREISTATLEIKFLALILYPCPLPRSHRSVEHLLKMFLNEFVTY